MKNNPWFFNYTSPCVRGDIKLIDSLPNTGVIRKFLNPNSSLEEVRDYFFELHNRVAYINKNYVHMVKPYEVTLDEERIEFRLFQPFFDLPERFGRKVFSWKQINFFRGIVKENILGDLSKGRIIIFHNHFLVDACDKSDLIKYNSLYKR